MMHCGLTVPFITRSVSPYVSLLRSLTHSVSVSVSLSLSLWHSVHLCMRVCASHRVRCQPPGLTESSHSTPSAPLESYDISSRVTITINSIFESCTVLGERATRRLCTCIKRL